MSRKWVYENDTKLSIYDGYIPIDLEICGKNGILNLKEADVVNFGIDQYYCAKNKNMSVYGSFYNDKFRYITLRMSKCSNSTYSIKNPGKFCKSAE